MGFAVVIAFYSFNIVFGRGVIAAGTTNNIEIETHNESIDSNADEILLLRENSWEELTVKQRVNVLQTVADIEKDYLGVNHNFFVLVDNTGKYVLGNYDNDTYNIKIDTDTIMYGSAKECLKIICHEAYHGYSYCMISALDNSQEELKNLKGVERPNIIAAIAEARSHGDLSENAEYSAAKEKQSFIEGRIQDLEAVLSRAQVIDVSGTKSDVIRFGATVLVADEDTDDEKRYQIVGDYEADIEKNKISLSSPLAKALIGKEVGDTAEYVAPGGKKSFEILEIKYI